MRRVVVLALCVLSAPAAAIAPREVLDAVQRLPPAAALEPALRAAPCAFSAVARHLDPLPANIAWAQPRAAVLFAGLPGLPPGKRAAVIRPTRELPSRAAASRCTRSTFRYCRAMRQRPPSSPSMSNRPPRRPKAA